MSQRVETLAAGPGWSIADIVCTSGAGEQAFEEQHSGICIAMVTSGTFRYRTSQGTAVMTPGSLLLGNDGACFECGHEHGRGDRCLSFHFTEDHWNLLAEQAGRPTRSFDAPKFPPMKVLAGLFADAEAARDAADAGELQEIGLRLAAAVTSGGEKATLPKISARDEKRVSQAIRLIENEADRPIALSDLSHEAATSQYHFLRVFRDLTGVTPYQFVLKIRLHRAALRLRTTGDPVSMIAFDAGFNDLSSFNRRFRTIIGSSPTAYRASRRRN
jgi:AraC-like DNA-binding protein